MNNEEQTQDMARTGGIQRNHTETDAEADTLDVSTDVKAGGYSWAG